MKTPMTSILFLCCTVLCIVSSGYAQQQHANEEYRFLPAVIEKIDSLMAKAVEMRLFSGTVLIANKNAVVYDKAFGDADYEKKIANTSQTQFQLASITKDFTKVLILQLVEQQLCAFADTVGKYLHGFAPEVAAVSIEQLFYHTSGLGDYHSSEAFSDRDMIKKTNSISNLLPVIQQERLLFKPGSQSRYSNSGYVVLAAIIEKIRAKSYGDILQEQILDKLGMTHTGFSTKLTNLPGKAIGYLTNELGPFHNNLDMEIIGGGDGGIYSTSGDLYLFVRSLLSDNKLLSNASKTKVMSNPYWASGGATYNNWEEFLAKGRVAFAGGAPGISSLWSANMKTGNVLIILSNFDERTSEEIGMRVGALLNNMQAPPLREPAAKFIYKHIKQHGGAHFEKNARRIMEESGMEEDNDMILWHVGRQLREEKDWDNALSLYRVYTTNFPNIIVAWNDMADVWIEKADKKQARQCYEQVLKLRPENPRAKAGLRKLQ